MRPHRIKDSNESYGILKVWKQEGMQIPSSCGWLFPGYMLGTLLSLKLSSIFGENHYPENRPVWNLRQWPSQWGIDLYNLYF